MDRYQYLLVMAACLLITLPLEFVFGARVYRQPKRLLRTLAPVVVLFYAWDAVAVARDHWWFDERYVTGIVLPLGVPLEELVFFIVIPICALLTMGAVRQLLPDRPARRAADATTDPPGDRQPPSLRQDVR
jgi:lycopene cyclase domain-containing protein